MLRFLTQKGPFASGLAKTLTGSALALSLGLTGLAATALPAAANNHRNNGAEAAAIAGGLLLLYGLSQAGRTTGAVTRGTGIPVEVVPPHYPQHPQYPQYPRPRENFRVAPAHCFVEGGQHGQYYRGYRARCMQQSVRAPHLLPQNCLFQVQTNRGPRYIYGARCLATAGWVREGAGQAHWNGTGAPVGGWNSHGGNRYNN